MNYPNRMAVRCWNNTCTALIILAALYFAGRICVAFTSGRVQQVIHKADADRPPMRPIAAQSGGASPGPLLMWQQETKFRVAIIGDDGYSVLASCDETDGRLLTNCQLENGHSLDELITHEAHMQTRLDDAQADANDARADANQCRAQLQSKRFSTVSVVR